MSRSGRLIAVSARYRSSQSQCHTRPSRRDFLIRGPTIDDAPVVQRHIVDPVGRHRTTVPYDVHMGTKYRKHATCDLVRRTRSNHAVAVHRVRVEMLHQETAARITGAADEDAAPQDRLPEAPN